jgi:isopentenyl-diphosphate delta-isomerase
MPRDPLRVKGPDETMILRYPSTEIDRCPGVELRGPRRACRRGSRTRQSSGGGKVAQEMDDIVLVDERGQQIGTGEGLAVHRHGSLHRAFSTFVFSRRGELLLQQRTREKYHSGGLWTNTCCGHPRPGENLTSAAEQRLEEEMGFRVPLREIFSFVYCVRLDNELTEHEYDHVHIGRFDGSPRPDPSEVEGWRWMAPEALRLDVASHPERYTVWFRICLERVLEVSTATDPL